MKGWLTLSGTHSDNVARLRVDHGGLLEQISNVATEFELLEVCSRIGLHFNLPHFSIFRIPDESERKLSDLDLISNWPQFLVAEYDANNLLQHSPVISYLQSSTEPLVFAVDALNQGRADGNESLAVTLFRRHGIISGVYFSVHLANGQRGAMSFCGSGSPPDQEQTIELHYFANLIYSRLYNLRDSDQAHKFELKENEINCLKWTSEGKTSGEIATILKLSEHTVNHYLKNAAQKLETSNRTHAVSKAIRLKIIK